MKGVIAEEITKWWYEMGNTIMSPTNQIIAQANLYSNFLNTNKLLENTLAESLQNAEDSTDFEVAFDRLFSREFGANIKDSAEDIINNNPIFSTHLDVKTLIKKMNAGELTDKELLNLSSDIKKVITKKLII
ncbi:hypothetical protein [Aliamphritea spongicola]|nr:hypothetical protein [Aliamphritea spongicola]